MTAYITANDLRGYIGSDTTNFQATVDSVVEVASRRVDHLCDRTFAQVDETRVFKPSGYWCLEVDDFYTTSGLVVKLDTGGDGTYATALTLDTDFVVEPANQRSGGLTGYPYVELRSLGTYAFNYTNAVWSYRPYIWQVTASWGWSAVPEAVKHATTMIAAQYFKMKDAADGFVGLDGWGPTQPRELKQIRDILGPYMKSPVAVG